MRYGTKNKRQLYPQRFEQGCINCSRNLDRGALIVVIFSFMGWSKLKKYEHKNNKSKDGDMLDSRTLRFGSPTTGSLGSLWTRQVKDNLIHNFVVLLY